jgi:myosin X
VFTYKQSTITNQKVTAMHPLHEEGVDDMASLAELHGGSIMYNLFQRYKRNQIYVSAACGSSGPMWSTMGLLRLRQP